MPIKYIVFEIQRFGEDQLGIPTPIYSHSDRNHAESEFHRLCSVAAISSVYRHTIMLVDDMGTCYEVRSYEHPVE